MSNAELETVIDGEYKTYQARIPDYIRIFNLPHQSYRYPIMGDLKGVMNAEIRNNLSMNVILVEFENDDSWNSIELREGRMYDMVEVTAVITTGDRTGEEIQSKMFIGREGRTNDKVYPLPAYYQLVKKATKEYGSAFYEEYIQSTYMQLNGMLVTLEEYESNAYSFNHMHRLAERINAKDKAKAMNFKGHNFDDLKEPMQFQRDYFLQEVAKHIIHNENTPTSYQYMLQNEKIEFYRGTIINSTHDNNFWARFEGMQNLAMWDMYFDQRKNIPYGYKEPIRIIIDRSVLPNTSVVVQLIAQVLLGIVNPMNLTPWVSDPQPVTMMWKHYMEGLFKTSITLERQISEHTLEQPSTLTDFEPGRQTALYDSLLATFGELTIINNEIITRREHVQFPFQLPRDYEDDFREEHNRTDYWTQWMWFYSKHDRLSGLTYSFWKFEENVEQKDIIQINSARVNNGIKYKQRGFSDETFLKYLRTPHRNYTSEDEVLMISDEYE